MIDSFRIPFLESPLAGIDLAFETTANYDASNIRLRRYEAAQSVLSEIQNDKSNTSAFVVTILRIDSLNLKRLDAPMGDATLSLSNRYKESRKA